MNGDNKMGEKKTLDIFIKETERREGINPVLQDYLDVMLGNDNLQCEVKNVISSLPQEMRTVYLTGYFGHSNVPCSVCHGYDFEAPCYKPRRVYQNE
jgi:hypothetical protein